MSIDWAAFTPWSALGGGVVIGLASVLYLWANGRIAGIAGVLATAWHAARQGQGLRGQAERWFFLIGLMLAPWLWQWFAPLPTAKGVASTPVLVLAGLLVGVGVRMGNGCTSGHGVCGLSRLSVRSLVNVLAFMGTGFATVALWRHGL